MGQCTLIFMTILHILMQYITFLEHNLMLTLFSVNDAPCKIPNTSWSHGLTIKGGKCLKLFP